MAVTYTIDGDKGVVYLKLSGTPTYREWAEAMDALQADSGFQSGCAILSDRSAMEEPPTTRFVREVADYLSRQPAFRGIRWAIVAPDLAGYGMSRMTEALVQLSGVEARSFHKLESAQAWLAGNADAIGSPTTPH